jgi:hypothetical protein
MFSFISKNWRGKPLIDQATVVNLIANTKTQTGLKIQAQMNRFTQPGLKSLRQNENRSSSEDINFMENDKINPNRY